MAVRNIVGIRAHYPLKTVNRLPVAVSCRHMYFGGKSSPRIETRGIYLALLGV